MLTLILIIHIVVAVFLIAVILLQAGKGAELGAVFGGGSTHALFGPTGAAPLLSKLTTAAAIIFMVTCLILAYSSSKARTVMPEAGETAPVEQTIPETGAEKTAPAAEQPTPEQLTGEVVQKPESAPTNAESQVQSLGDEGSQVDKDQDD